MSALADLGQSLAAHRGIVAACLPAMFGLVFGWGAMVGNDEPLATTALKSELTYSRQLGEGAPGVAAWTGGNPVGTNEVKLWLGVSETGSWTSDAHHPVPTAAISNPASVPFPARSGARDGERHDLAVDQVLSGRRGSW